MAYTTTSVSILRNELIEIRAKAEQYPLDPLNVVDKLNGAIAILAEFADMIGPQRRKAEEMHEYDYQCGFRWDARELAYKHRCVRSDGHDGRHECHCGEEK